MPGLKVSNPKTDATDEVGSWKDCDRKPHGIKRAQDPVKALGVFFTYD